MVFLLHVMLARTVSSEGSVGLRHPKGFITRLIVDTGVQLEAQRGRALGHLHVTFPCGLAISQQGGWVSRDLGLESARLLRIQP